MLLKNRECLGLVLVEILFYFYFFSFLSGAGKKQVKSVEIMLKRCKLIECFGSQSLSCASASVGG